MTTLEKLWPLLREHREGLSVRRNRLEDYLPYMGPYFRAVREERLDDVPPPICVQLQVTTRCGTYCRMCEHWREKRQDELGTAEWTSVLRDLGQYGVRTVIFSGGEPLEREDIAGLLRAARDAGLNIGLLTSGSGRMVDTPAEREQTASAIAETVSWVAVSIDGTADEDQAVRNPRNADRRHGLTDLCTQLKAKNPALPLSATVTLQKANIGMDLERATNFIHNEIGIGQVNFKLATGARDTLAIPPGYLLSKTDVQGLLDFISDDPLQRAPGNNLAYFWRAFNGGIFSAEDAAEGAPLHSFYMERALRCWTPFIFSVIDRDGAVYPCCHLYRDNHGADPRSEEFRRRHAMGNVITSEGKSDFAAVWNGPKYVAERKGLEVIEPIGDFAPCGECTRHCQHNVALNKVYNVLGGDDAVLDDLKRQPDDGAIWF